MLSQIAAKNDDFKTYVTVPQLKPFYTRPDYFLAPDLYRDMIQDPRYTELCDLGAHILECIGLADVSSDMQAPTLLNLVKSHNMTESTMPEPAQVELGYGPEVLLLLTTIANHVAGQLSARPVTVEAPTITGASGAEVEHIDTQDEILDLVDIESEISEAGDEEAEVDEVTGQDDVQWLSQCRRLIPQLRTPLHLNAKDWRATIHSILANARTLNEAGRAVTTDLDRLSRVVVANMNNISVREGFLASQLHDEVTRHEAVHSEYSNAVEKSQTVGAEVSELSAELNAISDQLDEVRSRINDRSDYMADSTPVVSVKRAINEIQKEIVELDQQVIYHQSLYLRQLKR